MAGGGTGGHVIPALAVARELRARGHTVRFIGTQRGMEAKLVPAGEFSHRVDRDRRAESGGIAAQTVPTLGGTAVERLAGGANAGAAPGPRRCFRLGGYVAGPVLLAALWKRMPVVVMEPNAIPGFTHRASGALRRASAGEFSGNGAMVSRGPRRGDRTAGARGIFRGCPEAARNDADGFDHRRQPGLAHAESRGGRELAAVEEGHASGLIHQTGAAAFEELAPRFRGVGRWTGKSCAFIGRHAGRVRASGPGGEPVGHGRGERTGGGGQAVDSGALARRPAISINCATREAFEKAGAARLVLDAEMTGARLVEEVTRLAADAGTAAKRWASAARSLRAAGAAQARGGDSGSHGFSTPLTYASESRNNTVLKCFSSPSPSTSSASAASA